MPAIGTLMPPLLCSDNKSKMMQNGPVSPHSGQRLCPPESAAYVRIRVLARPLNWADGGGRDRLGWGRGMGTLLASRRALAGYAVMMTVLVAVHYALPGARAVT